MSQEAWTVKSLSGQTLGTIRKLIIDSRTGQIAFADLLRAETNETIRIPWAILPVEDHGIFLKAPQEELAMVLSSTHSEEIQKSVTLEITTTPGLLRSQKIERRAKLLPPHQHPRLQSSADCTG